MNFSFILYYLLLFIILYFIFKFYFGYDESDSSLFSITIISLILSFDICLFSNK